MCMPTLQHLPICLCGCLLHFNHHYIPIYIYSEKGLSSQFPFIPHHWLCYSFARPCLSQANALSNGEETTLQNKRSLRDHYFYQVVECIVTIIGRVGFMGAHVGMLSAGKDWVHCHLGSHSSSSSMIKSVVTSVVM
jgi:hypothetical protein